ncbi:MAG: Gfo/Idh/MocA family oxidoreductase [Flavobacteriales bacterium]|nr:Gfo/Idh/MocA family oxidoreductase [Flavobacteriales bacterium]
MLKIGVLGGGEISHTHLSVLQELSNFDVTGFYAPDQSNAAKILSKFNVPQFTDIETLIQHSDAIDIASSTVPHYKCAELTLKNTKHLFIENPVTSTIEEARKLLNLTHEADVKVQIGNVERFNPAFTAIVPLIDHPICIETNRMLKFDVNKSFQSVVLDLMIHDIDLILSLVDSNVRKVNAHGLALTNGSPDYVHARLEFDNGCVATLSASRISFKDDINLTVYQRDSTYFVDLLNKKCETLNIKGIKNLKVDASSINPNELYFNYPTIKESNIIKEELNGFANAIMNNTNTPVTIEESYLAIEVADRILEKLKLNPNLIAD